MDMERVLKGSPWTFNNHLLILHKLQGGKDPLKIPLILTPFWIQVHEVSVGYYSKNLAIQLGNFIKKFMEYDRSSLEKENRNFIRIRAQIDIRHPLKSKKQVMFSGKCSYVKFKYEILTLFCFYCGRLGQSDSFVKLRWSWGSKLLRWVGIWPCVQNQEKPKQCAVFG